MRYKSYSNITCQIQQNVLRKRLEKVFIYTLKTDVFELPENKDIGNFYWKYELLFLDQSNFSSNPFQVSILQYPIPRASLPSLPSLLNFSIANWNPSSSQYSSCALSVSLFCPTPFHHMPQLLDITNFMSSQAHQINIKHNTFLAKHHRQQCGEISSKW